MRAEREAAENRLVLYGVNGRGLCDSCCDKWIKVHFIQGTIGQLYKLPDEVCCMLHHGVQLMSLICSVVNEEVMLSVSLVWRAFTKWAINTPKVLISTSEPTRVEAK